MAAGSNAESSLLITEAAKDSLYRKNPVELLSLLREAPEKNIRDDITWIVRTALRLNEDSIARVYLLQAMHLAEINEGVSAFALSRLAYLDFRKQDFISARKGLDKALVIYQKESDTNGIAYCKLVRGQIYMHLQKRPEALESFYEAYKLATSPEIRHSTLLQLGQLHHHTNDTNAAENFFSRALDFATRQKDKVAKAESYAAMGILMLKVGDHEKAMDYFSIAKNIFQELNLNKKLVVLLLNWGNWHEIQEEYDKALEYYEEGLTLSRQYRYYYAMGELYNNIGNCFYFQEQDELAKEYYLNAWEIANKRKDLRIMAAVTFNLHNVFAYLGQPDSALHYLRLNLVFSDSILNEEKQRAVVELQTQYKTKETADSLVIERKKAEISALHLSEAKMRNKLFSGGTVLFFLLAIATFLYFNQRMKHNRTIAEQKEKESRQQVLDLIRKNELLRINALMEGQSIERKRLGEELHDNLGSMLATVKLRFAALSDKITHEAEYDAATNLLDDACREVRKISHNLVSGTVTKFGLVAAVRELAATIDESGKVGLKVIVNGREKQLENGRDVAIYRIIQELASNIIKHSRAKLATISINYSADSLNLIIEDNGVGFEPGSENTASGIGLKNMRDRVQALNGNIAIDSTPGSGTIILLDLPIS
ncbi:MAG: tetratricopeptide repeat protein [Bacteroidia bacterium]